MSQADDFNFMEGSLGPINRGFSKNQARAKREPRGKVSRPDGEMYKRPEPNPFTPEWAEGYDDGQEGRPYHPMGNAQNYRDGYNAGAQDREELDRMGSSNA